jgi:hypothetical protein
MSAVIADVGQTWLHKKLDLQFKLISIKQRNNDIYFILNHASDDIL